MFPTSLKVVAVLLLCAVCFVGGRFASVWGECISEKEQMRQLIEDSDRFESLLSDLAETIRMDLQSFVLQSEPAIRKNFLSPLKEQLKPSSYLEIRPKPFRDQFKKLSAGLSTSREPHSTN